MYYTSIIKISLTSWKSVSLTSHPLVMSLSGISNSIYWMCFCSLSEMLWVFIGAILPLHLGSWGTVETPHADSQTPECHLASVIWWLEENHLISRKLYFQICNSQWLPYQGAVRIQELMCEEAFWKLVSKSKALGVIIICLKCTFPFDLKCQFSKN